MSKKRVVVWGASGHAKSVVNAIRQQNEYEIVGFLDDVNVSMHGKRFEGAEILGGAEQLELLRTQVDGIVLGFGHCQKRKEIGDRVIASGCKLMSVIHPMATLAPEVELGEGVVILCGALIDSGCTIGNYCIINTGAILCHECTVAEATHICPGVNVAGGTKIFEKCWIGIGTTVVGRTTIGAGAYIGAGAVVTSAIPGGVLAYGNPARIVQDIVEPF